MTLVEEERAGTADGAPRFSWRGRDARTDRRVLAGLVGFVVVWFVVPALIGHPLVPDDDLFQNVPLRVLSGDLLAHGQWPLWNRWIWSGTPLLGGLNAGALFPGTFLFAMFSPITAWVLNEIVAYALCAVGLYLLLRDHRLVPVAAAIGAATFTFGGFMTAQLRHFGLVQGMSFVPWMLLGLERLLGGSERDVGSDERARWWLVLVASGGAVLLTGEPRAWSNAAIAVGVYLLVLVWQHPTGRRRLVSAVAIAVPVVVALGAVQILPGLHVVADSQRSDPSQAFFASGSFPPYALAFQVVPYLLGGYGDLHRLPSYAGGKPHLPEISAYVGLLPLVALFTLAWWRRRASPRLVAWLAMAGVGLVLAFGSFTPVGDLLHHLPGYGSQRTQARNLALVDLGLAGIVACWVHVILAEAPGVASAVRSRLERACSLLPSAIVVLLILPVWIWRSDYQNLFEVPEVHPAQFGKMLWYFIVSLVLAVAVAVFVSRRHRLSKRHLAWALVALVVVDLGLALFNQGIGPADTAALDVTTAGTERLAAALDGGRLAIYDPGRRARTYEDARALAVTLDLTLVHELPSVQGYGSLVDESYQSITNTHPRQALEPSVIAGELADELDLRVVLVAPSYLEDGAPSGRGQLPGPPDPALRAALAPPHWRATGHYGNYLVFTNTQVRGRAWVAARPGPSKASVAYGPALPGTTVSVARVDAQDAETDHVQSTTPALLVRSVAFAPGWTAEVRTPSGSRTVTVRRRGLLQAVEVPAGSATVTWSYAPPGFRVGLVLTALACLGLLVLAVVLTARTLRRRPAREEPIHE